MYCLPQSTNQQSFHGPVFSTLFSAVDRCLLHVLDMVLTCQQTLWIHVGARGRDVAVLLCVYVSVLINSTNSASLVCVSYPPLMGTLYFFMQQSFRFGMLVAALSDNCWFPLISIWY